MNERSENVALPTDANVDPVLEGEMLAFPPPSELASLATGLGLTKRELFAAMAMQGICADGIPGSHHRPEDTARDAVAQADALLKELAK